MSKPCYIIANPRAFFMFGSYFTGWYCGDNDNGGCASFSDKFTIYRGVITYRTKKEASKVLKQLISDYPDCYIVKIDAGEENE